MAKKTGPKYGVVEVTTPSFVGFYATSKEADTVAAANEFCVAVDLHARHKKKVKPPKEPKAKLKSRRW